MIIFGPPGSGKGTQSKLIAEKYGLAHISTGEIFRREICDETELGRKVRSIIESGELVPDDILVDILRSGMARAGGRNGFLFDGYPRTLRQAQDLEMILGEKREKIDIVLSLEVDEEEVVKRLLNRALQEGRKDDTEKVIRNRMKVYHDQTQPLIERYSQKDCLRSIGGVGKIEEIFREICRLIDAAVPA